MRPRGNVSKAASNRLDLPSEGEQLQQGRFHLHTRDKGVGAPVAPPSPGEHATAPPPRLDERTWLSLPFLPNCLAGGMRGIVSTFGLTGSAVVPSTRSKRVSLIVPPTSSPSSACFLSTSASSGSSLTSGSASSGSSSTSGSASSASSSTSAFSASPRSDPIAQQATAAKETARHAKARRKLQAKQAAKTKAAAQAEAAKVAEVAKAAEAAAKSIVNLHRLSGLAVVVALLVGTVYLAPLSVSAGVARAPSH